MEPLDVLIAKDQIRDLAQLYSRGVDRQDFELLKTLYTADGVDTHGTYFDGSADAYIAFIERRLPRFHITAHLTCNHLISVDGDHGDGEVYALAWHVAPDGNGGWRHEVHGVRYLDRYRREGGRWRFAKRHVMFDIKFEQPAADHGEKPDPAQDPSYRELVSRLFARGGRA